MNTPANSKRLWMQLFAAVFAGGALGALVRVGVLGALTTNSVLAPWQALLCVNAIGSLALGLFMGTMATRSESTQRTLWLCFFGVGFCGTLTTFSAVARNSLHAIIAGELEQALGQLALQTALCVLLAGAGFWAAQRIGAHAR